MTTANELIESAESNLEAAKAHLEELNGENPHGLEVTRLCGFVVVDDEADRWIATEENFDEGLAEVIERVLRGKDLDQAEAYDMLCSATGCIYSRIGVGSLTDLAGALADLDDDDRGMVLEAMAIEEDEMSEHA